MRDQIMSCDAHTSKEQRACVARGARFQVRSAHGAAISASMGEQIYTGLFKSSYVGSGDVVPHVSLDHNPTGKPVARVTGDRDVAAVSRTVVL
jgi:hypothetical protein